MNLPPISSWPASVRVMLAAFVLMIGAGYAFAMLNIYQRHANADGVPGMSLDDLRAVYAGLTKSQREMAFVPSRMLTMVDGAMRQYIDDDSDYAVLRAWLAAGGSEAGLDGGADGPSPRRVITLNCLRCHAKDSDSEISRRAPFGPDQLTVEYTMLAKFTAASGGARDATVRIGPQPLDHLILITHAHMLAIPIFTLIVGGLFWLTPIPLGWRNRLTPLPMLALIVDFSGWWLARLSGAFVFAIAAAGAVYGMVFAAQVVTVFFSLCRGGSPSGAGARTVVGGLRSVD